LHKFNIIQSIFSVSNLLLFEVISTFLHAPVSDPLFPLTHFFQKRTRASTCLKHTRNKWRNLTYLL